MAPAISPKRKVFARLSIAMGNIVQIAGIGAAYFALKASRSAHSPAVAVATMILAWILVRHQNTSRSSSHER